MQRIVFTLCSNNYLAQAKVLGDSVLKYGEDVRFIIGLVDNLNEDIDYSFLSSFEIIPINKMRIPEIENLSYKYDIVEFNTAIKPYCFLYLFRIYNNIDYIYYIDPDIVVYYSLKVIESEFNGKSILLTPHITNYEFCDILFKREFQMLKYGIFNLGFLGLKRSDIVFEFLEWFSKRLSFFCYNNVQYGLFVDQIWSNLFPIYFHEAVQISFHLGFNVAYWNLHERKLSYSIDKKAYLINNKYPLVFFHFSNFDFLNKSFKSDINNISKEVQEISVEYANLVLENGYYQLKKCQCSYLKKDKATFRMFCVRIGRILQKMGCYILRKNGYHIDKDIYGMYT